MAEQKVIGTGSLGVQVVTPRGSVTETDTDAVTAPGEMGEFEVLPGHMPFLTSLHPGVLVLGEAGRKDVYAVSAGFLRVDLDGKVDVLVEQAVPADEIDTEAARADLDAASSELAGWDGPQDGEWKNLKARQDWAQARLDAK